MEDLIQRTARGPSVLTVVGTLAFDTLARTTALASPERTGGVVELHADAPGGTAGNVARALARLGARCALVTTVGPDFAGSAYARELQDAGVDLARVRAVERPTSRAYVFYDADGAQVTYFYAGASAEFRASPDDVAGQRAHFCAGEIARYPELMRAAAWVSFDPGQELFHRDFGEIEACLPLVDTLFCNRHELRVLEERGWSVARLLAGGPDALIETRGHEGTLVHTPTGRFAAPGVAVRAVDPTGAGDAHRAGFLYAIDRGAEIGVAARFANVLGSFVVEAVGAQTGQPTLTQALERYEKAYGNRPF